MRTRLPRKFSSGELAPWLDGISNDVTQAGCRTLENFIVKKQGQALRRPGTFFVKEVKDSSKATIIVPLIIDDTHKYILEFGDSYIRFFTQSTHSVIGAPYEVASPWVAADLTGIRFQYVSVEKALYCYHGSYPTRRLIWTSDASWAIEIVSFFQTPPLVVLSVGGRLALTDDEINWEEKQVPQTAAGDLFTAITRGADSFIIADGVTIRVGSTNGDDWISIGSVAAQPNYLRGTQQGNIVAVGLSGGSGTIYTSYDDGLTWINNAAHGAGYFYSVDYDSSRQHWMAVGTTARQYTYSIESGAWTSITEAGTLWGVGYGSNLWVAVGTAKLYTATSVAAPFTSITMSSTLYGVAMGTPNGSNLWVAVGKTSGGATNAVIYTSPTGTVWTQRYNSNAQAFAFTSVKWAGGKFIAVGGGDLGSNTPAGTIFATSPDGITWTINSTLSRTNTMAWQAIASREQENITDLNISPNYPTMGVQHEGRMIAIPYSNRTRVMGSKISKSANYYLGIYSEDAWAYDLASDGNVDVQWIMGGMGGLLVGTRTSEGMLIGSPNEGITPGTAQFRWISTFGSNSVQPVRIHDTIAFIQRGGEIVRGYEPGPNGDQSLELTIYADHIGKGGITKLAHQDDPQSILYGIRADGQLLALTFNNARRARYGLSPQVLALTAEEDTRAWARIKAAASLAGDAVIEDIAIIPTSGAEDEIWLVVKRTIGGSTKRYIEYMDTLAVASFAAAHYVDCGVYATSGTTFQTVGGLTHLAGENVDAFISAPAANIRWIAGLTVAASGTITTAPYSGTSIHVGLPYTSYLQTLRSEVSGPVGSTAGMTKKTNTLTLWISDSSALAKFGPTTGQAVETLANYYPSSTTLVTDQIVYPFPGQNDRDNYIWCIVSDPRPFTLVGILPDTTSGDY